MEDIASNDDPKALRRRFPRNVDLHGKPSSAFLSMHQVTTYRWSHLEDLAGYKAAGIPALGVWRPKLSEFGEAEGIRALLDSGLRVSSLSWAGGFTGAFGHSYVEAIDDAQDAIRVAGVLAADCVVVISGARAFHTANHARKLLVDALRRLGDLAASNDTCLALQPMHMLFSQKWTFLNTIDQTLDVLAECAHPAVRMSFDAYHLWQEPRLLERIPRIVPATAVVKLSDWRSPPCSEADRCMPGDGSIPLGAILQAFVAGGYPGLFEFEIWSEELWASDYAATLSKCRKRFDALWMGNLAPEPPISRSLV